MQRGGLVRTAEGFVPVDFALVSRIEELRRYAGRVDVGTQCEYVAGCQILGSRKGVAKGKPVIGQCEYPSVDRCSEWLSKKLGRSEK